jgi:PAS domain S-box-containing protein
MVFGAQFIDRGVRMGRDFHKRKQGESHGETAVPHSGEFDREIESVSRRAEELSQRVGEHSDTGKLVLQALEEVRTTPEELQVAEEELREQNEELLAARAELDDERRKYQELFDSAPDGYLVTDGNGKILEANRAIALMLGIEQRFMLAKPLSNYIIKDQRGDFRRELTRIGQMASTESERLHFSFAPRNGKSFDASLAVVRAVDTKNKVTLRWLLRDVSERNLAEEKIRALNLELEERVRVRTAELEQANALKDELLLREQQARAEAERANRSKDEFLAIVSHELRTPLNSILGWAQLMGSESTDETQRARAAEVIQRSALAQARIINDILDVSRIVTGNLALDMNPLNLNTVIEAAIEAERPIFNARSISLETKLESIVPVVGDSTRLQQVVGNMLSNSIKFTPDGGRIQITLTKVGDDAKLIVTDNGSGINPDFLPHVFDRFRQGDGLTTRRQGGLGLGLAIVSNLVKMHGGTVEAASDGEGRGASFTVKLPLAAGDSAEETHALNQGRSSEQLGTLAGVWIMVVDDDSDAREMMRAVLEGSGARVTSCGSCEEALTIFTEKATASLKSPLPEILVTDIAMPNQDGFDLIRAVRKLPPERGGNIPAIALTAYTSDEARSQSLEEGFQMHLAKPMHLEELVDAISRLRSDRNDQSGPPVGDSASAGHQEF